MCCSRTKHLPLTNVDSWSKHRRKLVLRHFLQFPLMTPCGTEKKVSSIQIFAAQDKAQIFKTELKENTRIAEQKAMICGKVVLETSFGDSTVAKRWSTSQRKAAHTR